MNSMQPNSTLGPERLPVPAEVLRRRTVVSFAISNVVSSPDVRQARGELARVPEAPHEAAVMDMEQYRAIEPEQREMLRSARQAAAEAASQSAEVMPLRRSDEETDRGIAA